MKTPRILILIACAIFMSPTFSDEFDEAYGSMVSKWRHDRDTAARELVQGWLRGGKADGLSPKFNQIVRLEIRLATSPETELYVNAISDPNDPEQAISEVVQQYLRVREVDFATKSLFGGKSYQMLREDLRPDMNFLKWEEK